MCALVKAVEHAWKLNYYGNFDCNRYTLTLPKGIDLITQIIATLHFLPNLQSVQAEETFSTKMLMKDKQLDLVSGS